MALCVVHEAVRWRPSTAGGRRQPRHPSCPPGPARSAMDGTGTLKQLGYTVALTPMNPTGLFHVRAAGRLEPKEERMFKPYIAAYLLTTLLRTCSRRLSWQLQP